MNEAWIWQYIFLEGAGSYYVDIMLGGWLINDIMLGGWLINDDAWLQREWGTKIWEKVITVKQVNFDQQVNFDPSGSFVKGAKVLIQ